MDPQALLFGLIIGASTVFAVMQMRTHRRSPELHDIAEQLQKLEAMQMVNASTTGHLVGMVADIDDSLKKAEARQLGPYR